MGLNPELHNELLDEFLVETGEHLDKVESRLLELEKSPNEKRLELIAEVFRSIHSIKGASGFMGYGKINGLAHVMETVLQMMRAGDISPEYSYIDVLLSGVDTLKGLLDDPESVEDVDTSHIHTRLADIIEGKSSPRSKKQMETRIAVSNSDGDTLHVNEFTLNQTLPNYDYLYLLKYDLHEYQSKSGTTPVSLVRNLLRRGAVVETRIETGAAGLKDDPASVPLIYLILYASNVKPEDIESQSGLKGDRITRIEKSSFAPVPESRSPGDLLDKKPSDPCPEAGAAGKINRDPATHPDHSEHGETVRVKVDILDRLMELAGELVLVRNQQMTIAENASSASRGVSQRLDIVTTELQETIMRTRMQPLGNIFAKLPRIVRDLSGKLNKPIEITISGSDVELDRTILETLTDPLIHLIRNCCGHGIEEPQIRNAAGKPETGSVAVEAYHEAGQINIRIRDDGGGIDPSAVKQAAVERGLKTHEELSAMDHKDILSLVFLPGFSTVESVNAVSGRGVGMDVVKSAMDSLGGSVDIDSAPGRQTVIHLRLPLTLAIVPCLIVTVGEHKYAIPQVNLVELVCLYDEDAYAGIEKAEDQEVFRLRDRLLPMVRLSEILNRPRPFTKQTKREITDSYYKSPGEFQDQGSISLHFAVVKFGLQRYGLIVDSVQGAEEIVVKPMHSAMKSLGIYSGATVMGDGRVAMILDIEGVARHAGIMFRTLQEQQEDRTGRRDDHQTVLLFKSGPQEQFAVTLPLIRRIERIQASRIEKIGDKTCITIDGVTTLILVMDEVMNVSGYEPVEEPFLLLPKHMKRPFGVLISAIIDIADAPLSLNTDSYMADGLMGTAIIRNKTTLFLDVFRLIELAEPEWFSERRKLAPPPDIMKKILLVEDASFFRRLVSGYLESDHYEVTTAENGKQALDIMNNAEFDLIVSDLEMPVMNGWRFMEAARSESKWADTPAVALTALDSEADKSAAVEAGFDAYVIKIDREELLTVISNLLRKKRKPANPGKR